MKSKVIKHGILFLLTFLTCLSANAQGFDGTWSGTLNIGTVKLNLVFHINGDSCTMDSPDQGARGIAASIKHVTADSINISISQLGVLYTGKLAKENITGTFTQMGQSLPLSLKRGEIVRLRPQTPVPPYPYKTEDITFNNAEDSAKLAGTLTYPVNYEVMNSLCPVVLMVTGSGLQNRDEELFGHKPFLVISDYLARHGIASLRYDDRGYGKSTGDATNSTTENFMRDAKAGVEYLKSLGKFNKVGVLGHSEGAMIAFMLGHQGIPDFIISMAGPGIKGDSIITEQNNATMRQQGLNKHITVKEFRKAIDGKEPNLWYKYFINYDPTADLAATKCPVFAINGGLDTQVNPQSSLASIKKLLPYNKYDLVKEYQGLNHLFQHAKTGAVTEYGDIEETISPEVLKDIARWINGLKTF